MFPSCTAAKWEAMRADTLERCVPRKFGPMGGSSPIKCEGFFLNNKRQTKFYLSILFNFERHMIIPYTFTYLNLLKNILKQGFFKYIDSVNIN